MNTNFEKYSNSYDNNDRKGIAMYDEMGSSNSCLCPNRKLSQMFSNEKPHSGVANQSHGQTINQLQQYPLSFF